MRSLQRIIVLFATATILLTGLIVSTLSVTPFYQQLKREQEHLLLSTQQSRSFAIQEVIDRIRQIAVQITSRTKARENLQDYNSGKASFEEFTAYSTPLLTDALAYDPDALGLTRFDRQGIAVLQLGHSIPEPYRSLPDPNVTTPCSTSLSVSTAKT